MSQEQKENWLNKGVQGAMFALLAWNIFTTHQLAISMAVLNEKVAQIEKIISKETN